VSTSLSLGAQNWGFIYHLSRSDALGRIADAGYKLVELAASPPHLDLSDLKPDERRQIARELEQHQLTCVATNPIELNPISPNAALSALAFRQYRAAIELAAEVGADNVVMIPGRRNVFIPMPEPQAKDLLKAQLERLRAVSEPLGVTLAVEPVPFGFLQTTREVVSFIEESGVGGLGLTLDCANVFFAGADPAEEVSAAAGRLSLVHISDSWRDRFAHTQIGRGEIDFAAFARALSQASYTGPSVYELVDEEDPWPRIQSDWASLSDWGWCP
jgi:sugar phosphate isomerase/epimerase